MQLAGTEIPAGANPLGTDKISSLILKFSVPAVISMIVNAIYNMVDQVFIGHGIGMTGIAATNIAFPITTICTAAALLMGVGGALLVFMGVRLSRSHVVLAELQLQAPPRKLQVFGRMLTAFMLTITNPGVFFGFIAIFGTMNAVLRLNEAWHRPPTAVAGVVIGGVLWWLFLSFTISRFKERISEKTFDRINRWTGILIAAFGFALLAEAFT